MKSVDDAAYAMAALSAAIVLFRALINKGLLTREEAVRIILDEGGWTLTPGAPIGPPPKPTPDRLQTAIALASQCGLLNSIGPVSPDDRSRRG